MDALSKVAQSYSESQANLCDMESLCEMMLLVYSRGLNILSVQIKLISSHGYKDTRTRAFSSYYYSFPFENINFRIFDVRQIQDINVVPVDLILA